MLKAVRFDLDSHKELINYIENYKDKRGKSNHSEAIRLLMEKGFASLTQSDLVQVDVKVETPTVVDVDKLKEDIMKEIWGTIGKNLLTQTPTFTQVNTAPTPIAPQSIEEPKVETPKVEAPKLRPKPPANTGGGLMGNLLGNAQRG